MKFFKFFGFKNPQLFKFFSVQAKISKICHSQRRFKIYMRRHPFFDKLFCGLVTFGSCNLSRFRITFPIFSFGSNRTISFREIDKLFIKIILKRKRFLKDLKAGTIFFSRVWNCLNFVHLSRFSRFLNFPMKNFFKKSFFSLKFFFFYRKKISKTQKEKWKRIFVKMFDSKTSQLNTRS